jgi:hypothetical protein
MQGKSELRLFKTLMPYRKRALAKKSRRAGHLRSPIESIQFQEDACGNSTL